MQCISGIGADLFQCAFLFGFIYTAGYRPLWRILFLMSVPPLAGDGADGARVRVCRQNAIQPSLPAPASTRSVYTTTRPSCCVRKGSDSKKERERERERERESRSMDMNMDNMKGNRVWRKSSKTHASAAQCAASVGIPKGSEGESNRREKICYCCKVGAGHVWVAASSPEDVKKQTKAVAVGSSPANQSSASLGHSAGRIDCSDDAGTRSSHLSLTCSLH